MVKLHVDKLILISLFGLTILFSKPEVFGAKKSFRFLAPPPEYIEFFHFGFRESLADSLWLRWIQDSDECQIYVGVGPAAPLPPNQDFNVPRNKICDNSWGFKMLDAITKLAPRFKMPYLSGAMTLSVLVEDYEGAQIIFDRGIQNYPDDWLLLYRASYHYLFDRHDIPRAAELLSRAEQQGGPYWFKLLSARLYSKIGRLELAVSVLESLRKTQTSEKAIADIDHRLKVLKQQMNQ